MQLQLAEYLPQQLALLPRETPQQEISDHTFKGTKALAIHRWYPYVEGFSAEYVAGVLDRFGPVRHVYDPFGGAGTTLVEASRRGIRSYYSEVNPFMRLVAEAKVNGSIWACTNRLKCDSLLRAYIDQLFSVDFEKRAASVSLQAYEEAFGGRDYFEERHLRELLAAWAIADDFAIDCEPVRSLLRVAITSNIVRSSNMTRRADLRRRRADEYKTRVVDVRGYITEKVREIISDVAESSSPGAGTEMVSADARTVGEGKIRNIDIAVTSPPYLNGTNYFRNTKLEMWFVGVLHSEKDLRAFRDLAVTGGINDVSSGQKVRRIEAVERVAWALERTEGDRRIPTMVRQYFSDMHDVFRSVYVLLRTGGRFIMDIGDSRFYGVHVPTDTLLGLVAEDVGLELEQHRVLAKRYSRDKTPLVQAEMVFRK